MKVMGIGENYKTATPVHVMIHQKQLETVEKELNRVSRKENSYIK